MQPRLLLCLLLLGSAAPAVAANAAPALPPGFAVEELPKDPKAVKVVLVAGSNFYKPGEHEYLAGCAVLADLLRQTAGVAPVLAVDWPKKPETFAGARAVVFLFDGAEKHGAVQGKRLEELRKLADQGVGLVHLHQCIDYPKDLGDRVRGWAGGAWEKGYSQRAHWVGTFKEFPDHAITRGVAPFTIDDGWLFKIRFTPDLEGVTPLLRTSNPRAKPGAPAKAPEAPPGRPGTDSVVGWAFERPGGGRSFTFTGCHLHRSFEQEGYRRFLVNGILWSAGQDVPKAGAPVTLEAAKLAGYLPHRPAPKGK